MSKYADESVDQDLLLAFSTEPGEKPPESAASLDARVERLERVLLLSASQVESLKAEVATLVAAVNDIKTREIGGVTKSAWPRTASAIAATLVGIAMGVAGWLAWSNGSMDGSAIRPVPIAADGLPPVEAEPPQVEPAMTLASPPPPQDATTPAQAVISDAPARASARISEEEIVYVGTLSIDADPSGGRVYINRRAAGSAPLRVANLKAGSHLVWIEREGYRRWTQVVQVRSDRVSRVSASLEPLAAP